MQTLTLVSGNQGKLREWRRLIPANIELQTAELDLPEIQSLDLEAIVIDKAKRAYQQIGRPLVVEDVSAGLVRLGGLPGPFIKYFEIELGQDALFKLAEHKGEAAIVSCLIGYYDGLNSIVARADVSGSVVPAIGNNGFGFDKCFIVDGQTKTFGQLSPSEKDQVSHRSKAIKDLLKQLNQL